MHIKFQRLRGGYFRATVTTINGQKSTGEGFAPHDALSFALKALREYT